ncbi:MAG TPA: DUF4188 domain-containing protein [Micromonosporaceae bacterium]|nr:DUF4188 domain-containing protein [Micromonosporaceae bacterium]
MASVVKGRMSADIEGDFVVFLIGMRFNKPWKIHKWWIVFSAMPRMLRALSERPEAGMLGYLMTVTLTGPVLIQYWRSPEQLEAFSRDASMPHSPAWRAFNKAIAGNGDVGIWHETYLVKAGQYESVYGNMPRIGLAKAGEHVPVARKGDTAAQRRGAGSSK